MSVPPRPPFLSAELWGIRYHLGNLGIIMHYRIYSQYHLMREFFLWHSQPLGGGGGRAPMPPPWHGTDKVCQLITNVMTTVCPMTLDFR